VIKENVDFEKAFKRVKLAKSILRNFKIDGEQSQEVVKRAKEKAVLVALSSYKVNPWKSPSIARGGTLNEQGSFPFDSQVNPWNSPSIARGGTPKEKGSFPFDSQESLDPVLQRVLQRELYPTRKGNGKGKGNGNGKTKKNKKGGSLTT
jgi:hypothetical protein